MRFGSFVRSTVGAVALVAALTPLTIASGAEPRLEVAGAATLTTSDVPVSTHAPVRFAVELHPSHIAELQSFLSGVSTPGSAQYRHFLTPAQYAARFGATSGEVDQVESYFAARGITLMHHSLTSLTLDFSGSTSAVANALSARVAWVRTSDGVVHAALRSNATLPASIAAHVAGVVGLSNITGSFTHSVLGHATTTPTSCASAGSSSGTTPNALGGYPATQQATLYGLTQEWAAGNTGVGTTIGVYELGAYKASDVATYYACYGVNPTLVTNNVDGGPGSTPSDEATMDVEEAGVLAPGATIKVFQGPNTGTGPTDTYQAMADDGTISVVTTSWGLCEDDPSNSVASEQPLFEQFAAEGITVVAAAGDEGSSDCYNSTGSTANAVDDPASQPLVTGVGGLSVTSVSPLTQSVWNSGCGALLCGAGGGGVSTVWGRPAWQNAPGITSSQTMRMVPDLSVMADPASGFVQYYTGSGGTFCRHTCSSGWSSIGGTSIGAPLVAALVATAIQACGVGNLGFINPSLYAMASTGFNDVTSGNNDLFSTGNYAAGVGYDSASGLGSPNGANFFAGLCPPAVSTSKSAFSVSAGTANVKPSNVAIKLVDVNGNPFVNADVIVSAKATSGTVTIDGDPSTSTGSSSASATVTTDTSGQVSASIETTTSSTVSVSVSYRGTTLYTTSVAFAAGSVPTTTTTKPTASTTTTTTTKTCTPSTPAVSGLTTLVGGVRISASASAGSCAGQVLQWSINGTTWHNFTTASTTTISGLARHANYLVRLRLHTATTNSSVTTVKVKTN